MESFYKIDTRKKKNMTVGNNKFNPSPLSFSEREIKLILDSVKDYQINYLHHKTDLKKLETIIDKLEIGGRLKWYY